MKFSEIKSGIDVKTLIGKKTLVQRRKVFGGRILESTVLAAKQETTTKKQFSDIRRNKDCALKTQIQQIKYRQAFETELFGKKIIRHYIVITIQIDINDFTCSNVVRSIRFKDICF